ncbi:Putrescine transport system permease protein PotH [Pandoraea terrae]|uniref:Putrescine transport system permease protein PotH n=2 Tax=Pandoraea terrae TaxID=1537710 RepID=A0A5E4WC41_9BURK|nr:Putrescine transport system permease protein PotH [Pandoraea terrae]
MQTVSPALPPTAADARSVHPFADTGKSGSDPATPVRVASHWTDRLAQALLLVVAAAGVVFLLAPMAAILVKSVQDNDGHFVGLRHFYEYFHSPALLTSIWNSVWISTVTTVVTVPLAFIFAYGLTRSCLRGKPFLRNIALIPILGPTLLPAISFIFWFGNQGLLRPWMGTIDIYGPLGIVMSLINATFPHALMILITALSLTDARLYEAADALGTPMLRRFLTITLPGAKYGVISAAMIVFTYAISDFGIPKVIGGDFNVLATDIYKLVIGQQDFSKGAVVGLMLLVPVGITYLVDAIVQRKQQALLSARAVPYVPKPARGFDWLMATMCWGMAAIMLSILGMAVYASFVKFWPYNFSLSFNHYRFGLIESGAVEAYVNSLQMAFWCALWGTLAIFVIAYLLEKTRGMNWVRGVIRMMAVLPMGVPGLVLGLGYIFFFVPEGNPLHFLYGSLAILVIVNVVHYYSSSHLTALTALKQIDPEFEYVSASLKVPFYRTFWRVTAPICLPSILEISRYLFVNAMTTVSAVVFLYSADTAIASVAIVNMDETGSIGPAAAMATLVVLTSMLVCLLYYGIHLVVERYTQAWRRPAKSQ